MRSAFGKGHFVWRTDCRASHRSRTERNPSPHGFDGGDGEVNDFQRKLRSRMDRTRPWVRYGGRRVKMRQVSWTTAG